MLARDPLGIVQVWSERPEEGKQAVLGAEAGALGALVLELRLNDRQDDRLLLRFRRALGDGSAGRPGLATARHIEGGIARG